MHAIAPSAREVHCRSTSCAQKKNGPWSALGMREQTLVPKFKKKKQYLDFSVFLPGEGRTVLFWAIRHTLCPSQENIYYLAAGCLVGMSIPNLP